MKQHDLKVLKKVDVISQVEARREKLPGQPARANDGWCVCCLVKKANDTLEWDYLHTSAKANNVRVFSTLDAVATCLLSVGITDFLVVNHHEVSEER